LNRVPNKLRALGLCALGLVIMALMAAPAHAHGMELVTPFVIWPALVLGLVSGGYCGLRGIARLAGLGNTLGIYLLLLAIAALYAWQSEIESAATALQIVVASALFGVVLGIIPLVIGYVAAEVVVRRVVSKRCAPINANDR
jgi:hypothetical protein